MVKFSIYLYRRVFVMEKSPGSAKLTNIKTHLKYINNNQAERIGTPKYFNNIQTTREGKYITIGYELNVAH